MNILIRKDFFNLVYYWLISLLLLVGLIVVVGGLTRLTDSGLSITTWDVVSGILPPLNKEDWEIAFSLYKKIPQFYLINANMSLAEFKIIYYWEYIHRILGRILGLFFLIPLIFFIYKKVFSKEFNVKFILLFALILLQGTIGWYMVKSGLVEKVTVSHFRLAIHLNLALILFSSLFWYLLNLKHHKDKIFFNISFKNIYIKIFIFLVFAQITFGAFTSGLDAGMVYQTWPMMNESYFPDDVKFTQNVLPLFSDASFIQFVHRNLAYLIFLFTLFILYNVFNNKIYNLYYPAYFLGFIIILQVFLGIITLVSGVNIVFASLHQISSIFLIISSIYFYFKSIN